MILVVKKTCYNISDLDVLNKMILKLMPDKTSDCSGSCYVSSRFANDTYTYFRVANFLWQLKTIQIWCYLCDCDVTFIGFVF